MLNLTHDGFLVLHFIGASEPPLEPPSSTLIIPQKQLWLLGQSLKLGSDLRNRNFSLYAEITTDIKIPRRH